MGKEPVSLTAFGTIMKGELGVLYEERPRSKRGFYVGIALVSMPKLVAGGSAARLGPMARPAANPA